MQNKSRTAHLLRRASAVEEYVSEYYTIFVLAFQASMGFSVVKAPRLLSRHLLLPVPLTSLDVSEILLLDQGHYGRFPAEHICRSCQR